jgi:hypothetical protein
VILEDERIEYIINKTIIKLRAEGLLRDEARSAVQKTEDILRNYPYFKLSDQPFTQNFCKKVDEAIDKIRGDYYFEIITMYYFDDVSRENIAAHFRTSESTISRNGIRLVEKLSSILFPDDMIIDLLV